jgi:hypothetical protein
VLELWSTIEPCPHRQERLRRPWNREHQPARLHRTRSPPPYLTMATLPSLNPLVSSTRPN